MIALDEMPVDETTLPRYLRFRGKKVRVVGYLPKTAERSARFVVIDTRDNQRQVTREQVTFIRSRRTK